MAGDVQRESIPMADVALCEETVTYCLRYACAIVNQALAKIENCGARIVL